MEFSHLLAELKNASEEFGKNASQNSTETSKFCQTVCKVAENLEQHIKKYENQIIGLWVIYGYVTELYPKLEIGQATLTLCQKLFDVSARIVLDVQWGQLDEDQPYKNNFRNTLTAFHQVVSERERSSRFSLILSLMETHWTHPTLGQVMSNDEDDEEGSGLAYITSEDPDILRLRVEMMLQQNCEEFALNLCTWCLKHPALKSDLDIRQIQLTLMDKLHDLDRLQEEAETISPKECVSLVQRFMELPKNQKVCTVLTQTFLVQNWIKEGDDAETIELFKLWIKHQYMVDEDEDKDKLISNLWAIAKLSRTTEQIVLIIDLIREKCGDSLLQFYTDMCIYAINIDKSVLEKSMQNGEMTEIQTHQQDMSLTCCKLADIFRFNKLKTARYSIVTAFSLNPSYSSLTKVESFYRSDDPALLIDTGQHIVAKCCGNCTYNRGACSQKNKDERNKINPATVYEVERLLNMLRPYHLKPELSWKELGPACTKYLQERERILSLMAEAEAKKKAQPNQLSHQQLAASLREKLLVAAGHNKATPVETKPPPKPMPAPVVKVEASTETKSYASNLQQVVENLQKRLGKSPSSSHGKVRPRTGQSINLANNSGNVNSYSISSANQLPTASQILAQKKSDAESIRQRTTQQIAATIQQTFLRQHEPEKPNFMVRVHNTNPSHVPTNSSIRQTFVNPTTQQPQRFISRPQELNKQYLVRLQQQQASKVRMLNPQQIQSSIQTVQQTVKNPQQIIHNTVDSLNQLSHPNSQNIIQRHISPGGRSYSTIQIAKGQNIVQGYPRLQTPVSQRSNQGMISVGYQNTRPQVLKQVVPSTSQYQVQSQTPQQYRSSAPNVQSMKTSQTVVNRVTIPPTQYVRGPRPPTSQEVIQQAKNQLYTLSQKKSPSQPLVRVHQQPEAKRLSNTTASQFIEPGGNTYSTSQGFQIPSPAATAVQFQEAQQLLQTQSLKQGDMKTTKVRGLAISSSSAHQATLALADKSKMIKKRPVTGSQVQLLAKAEAQGYASGKAVVKILQSQGMNVTSPTSPGSSEIIQSGMTINPVNSQQLMGSQQYGSRLVTPNQPQHVIQKTVIQSPTVLQPSSIQQVQPVYQQRVISTQLNPVQTDLNTLLTVASANTRPNTSQSIAVMPTTMNVYRTMPQNVLNPTVQTVQSDLSSITPTIPQLDSQQFRQLQNQVTASQSQHTIPTPNLSAQQLQEELNKINQPSQHTVSSNPDMTITVKPSRNMASTSSQKLQPNVLKPKISTQSMPYHPKVQRSVSSMANPQNQQFVNQKSSTLQSLSPQLHRMLVQSESSQVPQIPKQTTISEHPTAGLGEQSMAMYGNMSQRSGNVTIISSQSSFQEENVKTEVFDQGHSVDVSTSDEQHATAESVNSDKYAEEQKNIFVKSLLNASDEILETLSALPDTSLITDLFKNANPGDELHIELSNNIEDLGIDDMSSLIIPETVTESTDITGVNVEQAIVEEPAYVPVELDPAAQSLRDVQGIHIPDYNEQYPVNSDNQSQLHPQFTMLNPSAHQINEVYQRLKTETDDRESSNLDGKASMTSKKCGSVFKCIICSSVFSSLESLQYHVQRVCKPDESPTNIYDTLKLPDSKSGGINAKTIYQCVKCSSICISEKEMQLHTKNCPKENAHLFGPKKSEHTSVLPSINKDYQSVKRLVEKQQMEIQKEKAMMKAKKEREQQLKKIQAQRVLQKQKELRLKREAAKLAKAPPPPKFKEMTSSSGKTFYKCDLCGQTFCSPEGVHDHWLPCLKKNPITKRIRRPNPEKRKLLENPEKFSKMMTTIFNSVVGPTESGNGTGEEAVSDKDNGDTKDSEEVTEDDKGETETQKSTEEEKVNGESKDQKEVTNDAEADVESTENKQEQEDADIKSDERKRDEDAEKDQSSHEDEDEGSEDAQSSISTGTDISESDRSLRKRKGIRAPRYFFSSDSDEDMKKAKKLSQMESSSVKIFPEVELARLKKNSTCCLCSVKLKDMTIKLQHFAVKHLKIHTHIKSWKGHSFKCDLCNIKFNIYTKYVFHLKDHETEILKKISKMIGKDAGKDAANKTGPGRTQNTEMKLSVMAARKSVKKHLSPLKKPVPIIHSGRKRGRPSKKDKALALHKKHKEDEELDSDQRSGRRNVRAAHTQALSKIKNNANGFDILNTLPHFNVDVSSSGHSRSCSPEPMTTRRQTRSRRTSSVRQLRETDEESSLPDMSEKEIDLSDKEAETEVSQESVDSQDTEIKLSDLEAEEAEEAGNSETNDSVDKDTTDQDSVYKPSTSEDSQTSDQSSNLESKGPSYMSSFLDFIGEGTTEKEDSTDKIQTSEKCSSLLGYRSDPSLYRHLYKNFGKYKGTVISEPKKIQRGRRSVAAIDSEDSREKPQRCRRLSDSAILLQHKHLLNNSELRIVLQKLPEHLTEQKPGKIESVRTSVSDDTVIEQDVRGLSEERRLDSPAVNSPTVSEVSSRARSEEVEVIMMADTSPSLVISCLLESNTDLPPVAVDQSLSKDTKIRKSSEIVKLDNGEEDIILIETNSDDDEDGEDADDNTSEGDPVTVGASLTTCVVVKADTQPEGNKPSSSDLIIIENQCQHVGIFPNTSKNEMTAETKVEISQNNVTEIHVIEGAKISLLTDPEKLQISEDKCEPANKQAGNTNIEGQDSLSDDTIHVKDLSSPNNEPSDTVLISEIKPESPIPAINISESEDLESLNLKLTETSLPQPESPIPAINLPGSLDPEKNCHPSDSPIPAIDSTPIMSASPKSDSQASQLTHLESTFETMSKTELQIPLVESKTESLIPNIDPESSIVEVNPIPETVIPSVNFFSPSPITVDDSKSESEVNSTLESPDSPVQANVPGVLTNAEPESPIPAAETKLESEVPRNDTPLERALPHLMSLKSESPIPVKIKESESTVLEIKCQPEASLSGQGPVLPVVEAAELTSINNPLSAVDVLGTTSVTSERKGARPSSILFAALTKDLPKSDIKYSMIREQDKTERSSSIPVPDDVSQTEASKDTLLNSDPNYSETNISDATTFYGKELSPKEDLKKICNDDKTVSLPLELPLPNVDENKEPPISSTSDSRKEICIAEYSSTAGSQDINVQEVSEQNTCNKVKDQTASNSADAEANKSFMDQKDPDVISDDGLLADKLEHALSYPLSKSLQTSQDKIQKQSTENNPGLVPKTDPPVTCKLYIDSFTSCNDSSTRNIQAVTSRSINAKDVAKNTQGDLIDSLPPKDRKDEVLPISNKDKSDNDFKASLNRNPEADIEEEEGNVKEHEVSKDTKTSESKRSHETDHKGKDSNVKGKVSKDSSDSESKIIPKTKGSDMKDVAKSRQPMAITDTRFVRSVAHSIKLLNANNSAGLKIVDYSESDSEIDCELMDNNQVVNNQQDEDSVAGEQHSDPVIEVSTDEPCPDFTASWTKDANEGAPSSKTDEKATEEVDLKEKVNTSDSEKKPREAHNKSGELLTSIASKDFSSKDLPMNVADNLSKMPKIGSTVITKSGNKHKILDVKITQPEKQVEEDIPEAGKRSGLIQSLREQIKVEPFKWDEEEEDSKKKDKNERSCQAIRNQAGSVAPFTWDVSESEQSSGGESPSKKIMVEKSFRSSELDSKKAVTLSKGTEKKPLDVTALKGIRRLTSSSNLMEHKPAVKEDDKQNSCSSSQINSKASVLQEDCNQSAGTSKINSKYLKRENASVSVHPVPKEPDSKQQQNSSLIGDQLKKQCTKTISSAKELKPKNSSELSDTGKQSTGSKSNPKPMDPSTRLSSAAGAQNKTCDLQLSTRISSASNSQSKSLDSQQSTRNSSSVNTPGKLLRGTEPFKNSTVDKADKCSTRSSTKPFVRTSERQRLRQLSPNKFTRHSPSKSSPLKKSLNHLRYRDKNGKNIRRSPIRISHHLGRNSRRTSDKSEDGSRPKSTANDERSHKESSNVSPSNRESDKQTRTLKRENSEQDLHNNDKKLKSGVETSSNSSETSNSDNPSPVRRSKRRLERLHRKLCCDEDQETDKKRKLDDTTDCRHGPSSTCSSCVHGKKIDAPLPAVVRRSSSYRRHSYHHTQEIKKVKHTPSVPRNVTMVRVECEGIIKDARGHQRSLSDRKPSDQDNKWKFRPRNKNKKYPYTYTRAREKE